MGELADSMWRAAKRFGGGHRARRPRAVMLPNCPEFPLRLSSDLLPQGRHRAGGTLRSAARRWRHILRDSGSVAIVVDDLTLVSGELTVVERAMLGDARQTRSISRRRE